MNRSLRSSLLLILTACAASPGGGAPSGGAPIGGPSERVFGTIAYYDEPITAAVPAFAEVDQPFTVSVTTYGGGCLVAGETDVRQEELRAEIRPYDYNVAPGSPCDDALRRFEHTKTVRFAEPGEAEIVFYGQKQDASGTSNVMETRTLEVYRTPAE